MAKIRVTKKVRSLLVELDNLFQQFDAETRTLAEPSTPPADAMNVGKDRVITRNLIFSKASEINRALKK